MHMESFHDMGCNFFSNDFFRQKGHPVSIISPVHPRFCDGVYDF